MYFVRTFLLPLLLFGFVMSDHDGMTLDCPCQDKHLCQQLTTPPAKFESFIFSVSRVNYKKYDWSRISTLSIAGDALRNYSADIMCTAHSNGVRVVPLVDYPRVYLTNKTARTEWVQQQVKSVKQNYWDGVNFDFEEAISKEQTEYIDALTALTKELYFAMKNISQHMQITFDTPCGPTAGGRYFDYVALAKYTDFLVMMDYDMNPPPRAGANSAFNKTESGTKEFVALGISADKLVSGLPWYGYNYPCYNYTKDNVCYTHSGTQFGFADIVNTYLPQNITGVLWDDVYVSPYFSWKDATGQVNQIWFDSPISLTIKNDYARKWGLRGVGVWQADTLDYSDKPTAKTQTELMWKTMPLIK